MIALVLLVQCLGFADGGLVALGANVFNMAVIGCVLGYFIFYGIKSVLPKRRPYFLTAAGIAAWLSVFLASGVCAVELSISGTSPLSVTLPAMLGVHSIIGVGEALITVVVVGLVLAVRPDIVRTFDYQPSIPEFEEAEVGQL